MGRARVRTSRGPIWVGLDLFVAVLSCGWGGTLAQSNMSFIPAVSILLNCGASGNNLDGDGRMWVGDKGSKFAPAAVNSVSATASTQNSSVANVPYMTARIFPSAATYSFPVSPGRYFLRLHFYPSAYGSHQPSNSLFGVTANSYRLLHNFSASQTAEALTQAYVFREFSLNVPSDLINVTFTPVSKAGTYAFVNGIEVVSMPDLFQNPATLVGMITSNPETFVASNPQYTVHNNTVLQTMFRLNVGGQSLSPSKDSNLTRNWYDDTPYFIGGAAAGLALAADPNNVIYTSSDPDYFAPRDVYATWREMALENGTLNLQYNFTWVFNVDPNFQYLVRLHFCEWVYSKPNQRVFNIFINNEIAQDGFDVIGMGVAQDTVLYMDYAIYVEQPQSGDTILSIAMHPDNTIQPPPQYYNVLLNGLELFKLNDSHGNLAGPNPVLPPQVNYTVWTYLGKS